MASKAPQMVRGSFTGTGSAINVKVPEKPLRVELINMDDEAVGIYHDHMADGALMIATTTFAKISSGGVTLKSKGDGDSFTGFEVGTDANFNTAGEQVHWTAWY